MFVKMCGVWGCAGGGAGRQGAKGMEQGERGWVVSGRGREGLSSVALCQYILPALASILPASLVVPPSLYCCRYRKRGVSMVPCKYSLSGGRKAALVSVHPDGSVVVAHGGEGGGRGWGWG